jgi:hypothetical protein
MDRIIATTTLLVFHPLAIAAFAMFATFAIVIATSNINCYAGFGDQVAERGHRRTSC